MLMEWPKVCNNLNRTGHCKSICIGFKFTVLAEFVFHYLFFFKGSKWFHSLWKWNERKKVLHVKRFQQLLLVLSMEFYNWNLGAGVLFGRSCFFICQIKTLKSTCAWSIETKTRYWKALIFSVDNGRQVLPGMIQRIKVRLLLRCSLPWLLQEKAMQD